MRKLSILIIIFCLSNLTSCSDNQDINVAKAPVDGQLLINPSATTIILTKAQKDEEAIRFNWEVSDFGVSTPQEYTIEIDVIDGDFSNPQSEVTENTDFSLTHAKLNSIALSMDLLTGIENQIKVRLKTSLNYGALSSYSKVETLSITPYEDLFFPLPVSGELYLQGDAVPSNWGYPVPEAQKLTKVENKPIFKITIELIGNRNFAFISSNQGWGDPAYVALAANQPATGGSFTENGSGTTPPWQGTAISSPLLTGTYEVVIDFVTGKYSVTAQQ